MSVIKIDLVFKHFNVIDIFIKIWLYNIPLANLSTYALNAVRKYVESNSYVKWQSMLRKEHPSMDTH